MEIIGPLLYKFVLPYVSKYNYISLSESGEKL